MFVTLYHAALNVIQANTGNYKNITLATVEVC